MQREKKASVLHFQYVPRSFWCCIAFAATYLLVFGGWVIFNESPSPFIQTIQSLGELLAIILSFALSWIGIKRCHFQQSRSPRQSFHLWVPLTLSLALLFQSFGNILYAYAIALHQLVFPSWAYAFIMATYPALILSILLLPTHALSQQGRLRVLLDSLIIIAALVTFSWYFVLGPTFLQDPEASLFVTLAHCASPAMDLLLISCLIFFTVYVPNGSLRFTLGLLSVGLICFVLADTTFQYQALHRGLSLGWTSLGWPLGNFLIALSAQTLRWPPDQRLLKESVQRTQAPSTVPLWRALLPYAFVPAGLGVALFAWHLDRTGILSLGTYSCGLLLLALIFVRQVIAVWETHRLNRRLQVVNDRLELLATTDSLTELPNHRALLTALTNEVERAQRYQRSCTLLFFDVDHFKALNDSYGHAAGDEALISFAQRLRQSIRGIDTAGRWGGEEFLAILPETTVPEAQAIAERIRIEVSQQPIPIGAGIYLTCSIGLASYPTHATAMDALINAADQAMYAAKQLGRNQHRVIDEPAVQMLIASGGCSEGDREEAALKGIIKTLASLMSQRDRALGEHSQAVADMVEQIASRMCIPAPEAHMFRVAGQLHDLGKIGIPDAILQKPTPLTAEEGQRIKLHPIIGAEVVANIAALRPLSPVIRAHHERWDGTGYPDQLQGEHIPLAARMIAVADAYMAMIADRPYRQACSSADALSELRRCSGTQFDPSMVEALVTLLDEQIIRQKITSSIA